MLNKKLFAIGDQVAVALSGGKDSMYLLNLLLKESAALKITVKAINVEHGIRGATSERDSNFVREYCDNHAIPLLSYKVDSLSHAKNNGFSVEQSARILRYDCFKKTIKSGFCNKVATAHHLSDDVETILMNVFRGTSVSGLCGIGEVSNDCDIIRPILDSKRDEIDLFIEQNNIPYVIDETNSDDAYTRNFMRNQLIPLVKSRFPSLEDSVARLSRAAFCDNAYLNSQAEKIVGGNYVVIAPLSEKCIFYRACIMAFKKIGFVTDYTERHLDSLYTLCSLQTGSQIKLRNNITAVRQYDRIVFVKVPAEVDYQAVDEMPLPFSDFVFGNYSLGISRMDKANFLAELNCFNKDITDIKVSAALCEKSKDNVFYFDEDKLPQNSVVRFRRSGDTIVTINNVNKTIKKFFTDKKISSLESNCIPLVCCEQSVYIVCGITISELIKVDKNTRNVIKLICNKKGV